MGTIFHGNQPYSGGGVLNIVHKTWEQYRALSEAEKHDASKYYFVPDAPAQGVPGVVADLQDEVDTLNSNIFVKGYNSIPVTIPTIGALSANDVTVQVSCDNPFSAVIVESAAITNVYPIAASVISQTSIKIRFRNNDNTTYSNINTTVNVLFI